MSRTPPALPAAQVRWLRWRAQRLSAPAVPDSPAGPAGPAGDTVAQVVRDLCAVQAQVAPAAALAIRARSSGLVAADVQRARAQERSVVRTWAMRQTLHLLAAEDAGWLLALLGPHLLRRSQRRRESLGLDERTCAEAIAVLRQVLADQSPLTRAEIVGELARRGIVVEGQARPHLIARAALEAVVCLGPERGAESTYVLLERWLNRPAGPARPLPRSDGLATLARRYLAGHGPAGMEDFATWTSLPMADARAAFRAIASDLLEVEIGGRPAWLLRTRAAWLDEAPPPDDQAYPRANLLPAFDPCLLGYRERSLILPVAHAGDVHPGGGVIHPTLMVDGAVAGTWRSQKHAGSLLIEVRPFRPLPAGVRAAVAAEAADVGRFLGVAATRLAAG